MILMSSGQPTPDPVPSSQIIQQRIQAMENQNSIANAQLDETLQKMRDNLDLAGTSKTSRKVPGNAVAANKFGIQWPG